MLQYFIKIVDHTLLALLVISLWLAWAGVHKGKKTGLALGAAGGALLAALLAALRLGTGWVVREYYNLGVLIPALILALVWLGLSGRANFAGEAAAPRTVSSPVSAALLGLWLAWSLPDIFLSPPEFGVGMETIFNTDYLFKVIGYALALTLLLILGWSLYRMASRLPLLAFKGIVVLAMLVLMALQTLEVTQILVARNLIPRAKWLVSLVILASSRQVWFNCAGLAVAGGLALVVTAQARRIALAGINPAQVRKIKADRRGALRWCAVLGGGLAVAFLTITVLKTLAARGVELSPAREMMAQNGSLAISLNEVADGNLHRLQFAAADGTPVRFIIIKKNASAYGVGLDACDICGQTGYYQRGDQVVCKLCDVVMNKSTIGFPGGCNPVPLKFAVSQGKIIIATDDLESESHRFK